METTMGEEQATGRPNDGPNDDPHDDNEGLGQRIEELKDRIVSLNERAKGFIKEHPGACLMGALGVGYLFARLARRRS
jgi:hypothetical protein